MWRVRLYVWIHILFGRHPRIRTWVYNSYFFRRLMPFLANFDRGFSDRRYMTENILPTLAPGRVQRGLFVGWKEYTARYGKRLTRAGVEYWTSDIDPAAAV